jgi:hypothetical protein
VSKGAAVYYVLVFVGDVLAMLDCLQHGARVAAFWCVLLAGALLFTAFLEWSRTGPVEDEENGFE